MMASFFVLSIKWRHWQFCNMAVRKPWTRRELLVLLNVYEKIPFGHFDQAQPVIQDIAKRMDRSAGSVAMKLSNLASLDPAVLARGRKGLTGASALDREMWNEFHKNHDELAAKSEEALRELFAAKKDEEIDLVKGAGVRVKGIKHRTDVPTETLANITVRRNQQFFRQMILNAFDSQCCVTGIRVRDLLVASHILPWSTFPKERLNPQNGLCLSRLHDAAFDRGLITFNERYELVMSKELQSHLTHSAIEHNFGTYSGKRMILTSEALAPKKEFLLYHRKKIFRS